MAVRSSPWLLHPKVAGAGAYGLLSLAILHLAGRYTTVPQWAYDYLPVVLAIAGGYITPTLKGNRLVTTIEQTLHDAGVSDELVDAVKAELARTGGDATNKDHVDVAVEAVTGAAVAPSTSGAPADEPATDEATAPPPPSAPPAVASGADGDRLDELEVKVAELETALTSLEQFAQARLDTIGAVLTGMQETLQHLLAQQTAPAASSNA